MTTTEPLINCRQQGPSWRVEINRPDKANALTRGMLDQLLGIFKAAATDPEIRALIISGAGDRAFCGGADLSELENYTVGSSDTIWQDMAALLARLPILTVARINGACIGGGLSLALGCDIRITVNHAVFAYPVLKNNVLPDQSDFARLDSLIGPGRSAMLLLGAARIDATEALSWGLVDRLCDPDQLENEVSGIIEAAVLASGSHLGAIKRLCRGDK